MKRGSLGSSRPGRLLWYYCWVRGRTSTLLPRTYIYCIYRLICSFSERDILQSPRYPVPRVPEDREIHIRNDARPRDEQRRIYL